VSYDINDIQHLTFREGIRQKIPMYLGSDDTEGIYQAFKEIINNSTDEALAGFGDKIEIEVTEDKNMISVRDYGRGVPFGIRENGENVLVSIYTESHTGGKFTKGAYANSSGLNGIGGSAVCLSSLYFTVESYRDGKAASASFTKGFLDKYREFDTKEKNGTLVKFVPDKEVFKNMTETFSFERICKDIRNISYLNKGIRFIINNKNTKEKKEYYSKNGIVDFVIDNAKNPLMKPIICSASDDTDEVEVAFVWTAGSEASYVFVNGLFCTEGGSPITGAKTTLTTQIKKMSGQDLDADLIRKGLVYAVNCKVAEPSFANQTKSKINNPNLRTLTSKAFKDGLEEFQNSSDFDNIIKMLIKIQRAEKAADRARRQILETSKEIEKNANKKVFNSDKLKDAEFLGADSTLLVVEGNSAAGGMANARDYKRYGILAIRGKIINCLSNSEERIADNEEIKLLLKAMNIIPGKYNSSKLRYGKIGICTDADSDGRMMADERLFA
jgi:DNA gyrase/topoisomerase IV subunit B